MKTVPSLSTMYLSHRSKQVSEGTSSWNTRHPFSFIKEYTSRADLYVSPLFFSRSVRQESDSSFTCNRGIYFPQNHILPPLIFCFSLSPFFRSFLFPLIIFPPPKFLKRCIGRGGGGIKWKIYRYPWPEINDKKCLMPNAPPSKQNNRK